MKSKFMATLAALAVVAVAGAAEAPDQDTAATPAVMARLAPQSLLLDLATAGTTLVAVGERGHILLSNDGGRAWQQVAVPVSANLTAVYFVDARHGWAVGHDEAIVRTDDGGRTWEQTHFAPEHKRPLLDVWFADAANGLAVGAYGSIFASSDGGRTWTLKQFEPRPPAGKPVSSRPKADDEFTAEMTQDVDLGSEFHLNAIAGSGTGKVYIGAEAGHLYRSDDLGATWQELTSPYDGSFYGLLPLDGESLLAFGLRGNLFRSDDGGQSWARLDSGTTQMLTSAARAGDRVVIAGLAGILLVSDDAGRSFRVTQQDDRKGFSSVLLVEGELVVAGEAGVRRLPVPTSR